MKKFVLLFMLLTILPACKSKKSVTEKKVNASEIKNTENSSLENNLVNYALTFDGVKYKYGGTTKKGMDCSGLVFTSYKKFDIDVPRTTKDLSKTGDWIDLKDVKPGDLLFFATHKNSRKINHVGIVTNTAVGNIEFIHASTSNGVIVSNLAERYWYFAFVQARRIL